MFFKRSESKAKLEEKAPAPVPYAPLPFSCRHCGQDSSTSARACCRASYASWLAATSA